MESIERILKDLFDRLGDDLAEDALRCWGAGRPTDPHLVEQLAAYMNEDGGVLDQEGRTLLAGWRGGDWNPLILPAAFRKLVIDQARLRYAKPIVDDLATFLTKTEQSIGVGRLVHVGPGGGKTRIAIAAICEALAVAPQDVYWVAHSRILLQQARDSWNDVLAECDAGIVEKRWGGRRLIRESRRDRSTGRFVSKEFWSFRKTRGKWFAVRRADGRKVARIHFLTHAEARKRLCLEEKGRCRGDWARRFVVVDEVHWGSGSARAPRPITNWSTTLTAIVGDPLNRVIGLSATPSAEQLRPGGAWERAGGEHQSLRKLTSLEDPQVCSLPEFYLVEDLALTRASDDARLVKLARWLVYRRGRNKKTLVLVERIEQARVLAKKVNAMLIERGDSEVAIAVHSEDDSGDLNRFSQSYNRQPADILFSVNMTSVGFDVRDIMTIVLSRPVSSRDYFEQCIGRGARVFGRAAGNRFRVVCTREQQRRYYESLYAVSTERRGHSDDGAQELDSHRIQLNYAIELNEADGPGSILERCLNELQSQLDGSWVLRRARRESIDGTLVGCSVRLTSNLVLHQDLSAALQTIESTLQQAQSQSGLRFKMIGTCGLNFTLHPFPGALPTYQERNQLARYLLLITSYLEPAIVTFGSPQQYGRRVSLDDELVDYRIGELEHVLPCAQGLHDAGRPKRLDDVSDVPSVFDRLRSFAGEARDSAGVDVERLLDRYPDVWVRFSIGPALQSATGMMDWVNLWRSIVEEAHRFARGEKVWLLPAPPRHDSLLPTSSAEVWFRKLLPGLEPLLRERLIDYARQNREHWRASGPSPAFWADVWPIS